ncbi:MAG: hypothetical protein Q9159_005324 [Coniocarpon cinnabarinum]
MQVFRIRPMIAAALFIATVTAVPLGGASTSVKIEDLAPATVTAWVTQSPHDAVAITTTFSQPIDMRLRHSTHYEFTNRTETSTSTHVVSVYPANPTNKFEPPPPPPPRPPPPAQPAAPAADGTYCRYSRSGDWLQFDVYMPFWGSWGTGDWQIYKVMETVALYTEHKPNDIFSARSLAWNISEVTPDDNIRIRFAYQWDKAWSDGKIMVPLDKMIEMAGGPDTPCVYSFDDNLDWKFSGQACIWKCGTENEIWREWYKPNVGRPDCVEEWNPLARTSIWSGDASREPFITNRLLDCGSWYRKYVPESMWQRFWDVTRRYWGPCGWARIAKMPANPVEAYQGAWTPWLDWHSDNGDYTQPNPQHKLAHNLARDTTMPTLQPRQYGYGYGSRDCYYNDDNCNSNWSQWGRWVLLVGIIVLVLFIFFVFSCLNARRRRRQGATPFRGTGWMAPGHGPVNYYGPGGPNNTNPPPNQYAYYGSPNGGQGAPPAYNPSHSGYYGQESGLEMQPPQQAHAPPQRGAGGSQVYSPPPGPPPGKETY